MSIITKVAIIGAGVSGLKAAETLLNNSRAPFQDNDIVIVDAQDRIGGRLKSDSTSSKHGIVYDLGAAWFHDTLTNQVLKDSIKYNYFDVKQDTYYDDKDIKIYDRNGLIDISGLKINRVVEDLEKYIELYYHEDLNVPDMSLKDIVKKFINQYDFMLTSEQVDYSSRIMRYLELWYGISWDKISAKYSIMDHQGRNLLNKQGYYFIIEALLKQLNNIRILLNQPISKINRSNKTNSKPICIESNTGLKIYCDYLIVTVPQSILQLPSNDPYGITWNPPLPNQIQDALSKIHFGALGKVIFEFDNVWWDETQDRFEILADSNAQLSENITSPPKPFTYPAYLINYASVHKKPSLVILTQSPLTDYLERNPDQAWKYYKPMLQTLVQNGKKLTDPINTITTDWTVNPYIRGSYAAVETGDDPSDLIIQLSGEFSDCGFGLNNIRFAGEHTIMDGAGCVHGAYNSGIREANWILQDIIPKHKL
ncbi:Corticosteroid-binding protein [Spathaspora sp. JA1]|nr:Corticosteroid-binding protein [Spathaspora sp. JA1]